MNLKRFDLLKKKPIDGMHMDFFAYNGQQEIYEAHQDNIFNDLKTPAVITFDNCDIKPVSF